MTRREEVVRILEASEEALTVSQIHGLLPTPLKDSKDATRKILEQLVLGEEVRKFRSAKRRRLLVYGIGVTPDFSKVPTYPKSNTWGQQGR